MGKKAAESFKEKSFMAADIFGRIGKIWPTPLFESGLGAQGQCRCLKALHDSVDANVYDLVARDSAPSDFEVDPGRFSFYK